MASVARRLAAVVTAAAATAVWGPVVGAQAQAQAQESPLTARPGTTASWQIVPMPSLLPENALSAAAVVSKQLAWAVGTEGYASNGSKPGKPLMLQWDGSAWTRARLPGSWQGGLAAVAASAATDAWALGTNASGALIAHLLHWNGHSWLAAGLPNIGGSINANINLAAAPGGRAWISTDTGGKITELFSWNGTSWRQQPYPCAHSGCGLIKITARSAQDAWAVGNYVDSTGSGGPLALHWTGASWTMTPVPFVKFGYLTGVFGLSATDAWAVGAVQGSNATLLYHWDGAAWHQMPTPAGLTPPPLGRNTGITGDSAGDLWIYDFGTAAGSQASYLRYDGHGWSLIHDAPVAGELQAIVRVAAAVPGTQTIWSMGVGLTAGPHAMARIERYG